MEVLVKKRSPVRANFTKNYNSLIDLLSAENPNDERIKSTFASLQRINSQLTDLDTEICNALLEDPEVDRYEAEYKIIEEYNEKMDKAKVKIDLYLDNILKAHPDNSVYAPVETKRKLKLPKIELMKFGGEIKDWLAFWSQFRRIHEDDNLDKEDKFQYLIQCMGENTRAREIIDSFPPTNENYDKAIECLKSRFGRDELLIEFYVRELLKLVVKNATEARRKLDTAILYDKLESFLRALESIGLTSDKYSAMLFPLVESCIPEDIFRVWLRNPVVISNNDSSNNVYSEKLKNLLLFLKVEVEGEERIRLARSGFSSKVANDKKENFTRPIYQPTANDLFSGTIEKKKEPKLCIFCEKLSHESKDCFQAQKLSLSQKQDVIKTKRCCFVCLKVGHRSKNCKTNVKCVLCNKKHLILMCPELPANQLRNNSLEFPQQSEQQRTPDVSLSNQCASEEILLQTLIVNVKSSGKERRVRVLIDSGSQHSYILERTINEMGIKPVANKTIIHSLFGGITTDKKEHHLYNISLKSLSSEFSFNIQVLDQQTICGAIPRMKNGFWNKELKEKKIWLTDFGESCPAIEVLIGADFCGQLFTGNMHKLDCGLVACETHLGWIIMGRVPGESLNNSLANVVTSLLIKTASIADLWKLDTLGIRDPVETKSKEEIEQAAVEQFRKTVTTDERGRYIVALPWIEQQETLRENREIAERRCILSTQKLLKEGRFTEYDTVFKEWLAEKIIEEVPEDEMTKPCHYLPHRGVFKKNSTTRVRPVFDASCRAKNSPSLNDCLEKGPNLIEELLPILMRFRQNAIGVVSDIRKAFLQISIIKEDQDFLRFLWWEDYGKGKLKTYRHRRVVFGLTCSPFLLAATLNFHLEKNLSYFPKTVERLERAFYVDNCVTSVSSEEELSQFILEAKHILANASFDLRGWEHTTLREFEDKVKLTPVLGLLWDKNDDVLFCNLENVNFKEEPVTRRNILSAVHSVFDPLGFLCPVTLRLKLLVQKSWTLKIAWDEICPEDVRQKFAAWLEDLPLLSEIKIPRYIHSDGSLEGLSLHTFCDASKSAYSAVVFLRRECRDDIKVHLILAKSRVAPLAKMTIPRLELLACCIGARLTSTAKREMNLVEVPSTHWTDSSTALYWIRNEENWGTFVNNRVKEIRNISAKETWKHIPGCYNLADLPSRGCSAKFLLRSRWWDGRLVAAI